MNTTHKIHTYDNGLKCFEADIFLGALRRYAIGPNIHEPVEEEVFNHILTNETIDSFIDIGSAWGYYSLLAKRNNQEMKVMAFDPDKKMCESVLRGMELNSISDISIRNEYISNRHENTYACAGIKSIDSNKGPIDLDSVIDEFGEVGLIKIDIQGLAGLALESGKNNINKVKHVLIGTHGTSEENKCIHILKNNGFDIVINIPGNHMPIQPDGLIWAKSHKSTISNKLDNNLMQQLKIKFDIQL